MHRATAELKSSGIEERALKVGDLAADFVLFNQDHVEVADGSSSQDGRTISAGLRAAGLFARGLQVLPKHPGQVQRRTGISIAGAHPIRD